jgi:NADH-quinone oxidoreductase subunit J
VLVYAGAVMVLFLFVIMLLNLREKEQTITTPQIAFQGIVTLLIGTFFVWAIYSVNTDSIPVKGESGPDFGSTASVGGLLYTDYILPFEIASVLLLAAIVGAVILAKTRI